MCVCVQRGARSSARAESQRDVCRHHGRHVTFTAGTAQRTAPPAASTGHRAGAPPRSPARGGQAKRQEHSALPVPLALPLTPCFPCHTGSVSVKRCKIGAPRRDRRRRGVDRRTRARDARVEQRESRVGPRRARAARRPSSLAGGRDADGAARRGVGSCDHGARASHDVGCRARGSHAAPGPQSSRPAAARSSHAGATMRTPARLALRQGPRH